ncbi:hypothetical protein ABIA38_005556 [Embleya sp. AB8]
MPDWKQARLLCQFGMRSWAAFVRPNAQAGPGR